LFGGDSEVGGVVDEAGVGVLEEGLEGTGFSVAAVMVEVDLDGAGGGAVSVEGDLVGT
jgi:hypothetical protein